MSILVQLLGGIWGKVIGVVVGLVSIVAALAGLRYKIRKGARQELEHQMQARTVERLRRVKNVKDDMGKLDRDGLDDWMSKRGYFRD